MGDGPRQKYDHSNAATAAGFTAMPNLVLRDPSLSGLAKTAYALLKDFAWNREEPELPEIAALLGCGEKAARGYLRELEDAGLLTTKRRGLGRSNAYLIHDPVSGQNGEIQNGQNARSVAVKTPVPSLPPRPLEDRGTNVPPDTAPTGPPKRTLVEGRDLGFDALAEACAVDVRNRARATEVAQALREIRGYAWDDYAGEDDEPPERFEQLVAAEVVRRAALYRQRMVGAALTPRALAKWWHDVDGRGPQRGLTAEDFPDIPDLS